MRRKSLGFNFIFIVSLSLFLVSVGNGLDVEPGGPTLAEQAQRALIAGDNELAARLFEKWLEADPGDYVNWYNYACALALSGRIEESFQALEGAVSAGWRDSKWPRKDPDLDTLKSNPRFEKILAHIAELAEYDRKAVAGKGSLFYVKQTRLAPYRLILPNTYEENKSSFPLLVLLHGRTGDYPDMEDLATRIALPGVIYALPRAPYPVSAQREGFEYWPRELALSGDSTTLAEAQRTVSAWVQTVVRDAISRARVDSSAVFIIGYSQGGAAAYICAMDNPDLYRGGAVLGGYVPATYRSPARLKALSKHAPAFFVAHGSRDRVIEISEAEYFLKEAAAAGIKVTCKISPAGHELSDEMVVDLVDWVLRLLRESNQPKTGQP